MVILVGRGPLTCMDRSLCKYVIQLDYVSSPLA
jgi:hypothetical protein